MSVCSNLNASKVLHGERLWSCVHDVLEPGVGVSLFLRGVEADDLVHLEMPENVFLVDIDLDIHVLMFPLELVRVIVFLLNRCI